MRIFSCLQGLEATYIPRLTSPSSISELAVQHLLGPPDNPGHLKILNLIPSAKSSLPYKFTYHRIQGSGHKHLRESVGGGVLFANHTQVPSFRVLSECLSPGVSRTVLKFSSHQKTQSSPPVPPLEAPGAPLRLVAEMFMGLQTLQLLPQSLELAALRATPPLGCLSSTFPWHAHYQTLISHNLQPPLGPHTLASRFTKVMAILPQSSLRTMSRRGT